MLIDTTSDTVRHDGFVSGQDPDRSLDLEYDIEIGADNATAYLAGSLCADGTCDGRLFFFDTGRGELQASLPLASTATSIAVTAGDRLAVLGLLGDPSIAVVDLASRQVAGYVALGEPVYDVAVNRTCVGDCNGSGAVTIDELVVGVRIDLDLMELQACRSFDRDGYAGVTVDEVTAGVSNALEGC